MLKNAASYATLPRRRSPPTPSSAQEPAHVSAARIIPGESRQRRRFAGDARVARRAVGGHRQRGSRARALPARAAHRRGAAGRHRRAVLGQHRLRQHHSDRPGGALPRQPRCRGAAARLHALERDGDGRQGQPARPRRRRRPRRPHLVVRLAGDDVRRRLQPFLARRRHRQPAATTAATCSTSRAIRRPASTPAPSWKAGSPRSSCSTSARRSTARASPAIRIRS